MKAAQTSALVFVTAPDQEVARKLVRLALENRLVACGNIIPGIESVYWWRKQIETSSEVLILFKTRAACLDKLERLILGNHPYDTPEIISLPLGKGTPKYLTWIKDSVEG